MDARAADSRLASVLAELRAREPLFHRPEHGTSRADYERMTAPDFWETGASGRRYSRKEVLDVLDRRRGQPEPDPWVTEDFLCRELAPELYLLTYTLRQNERVTRRATLWRHTPGVGWQAIYHQGTRVEGDDRA